MASPTPEPYFLKRSIWNTNTEIRTWMHISHFVSGLWASCWVFVLNNERGLANRTVYHVIKIVFYLACIVTHGHVNMIYLSNFTGNSFSRNKIFNYKPSIYFYWTLMFSTMLIKIRTVTNFRFISKGNILVTYNHHCRVCHKMTLIGENCVSPGYRLQKWIE